MAATLTDWLRTLRGRLPDTDADLLQRFGTDRDEEAFQALVARHGPMVFGVCRRVLGHGPDAEDAFQAVFVILAVKADSRIGNVGAWLHGVAFHTARKARTRRFRRGSDTADQLDLIPSRDDTRDPDAGDLREKLDEVLAGLPEKYRAAVVLCELEQVSRADAAGRLGWTEGTLSGRLARARKLLADRLSRRGITLGAGGLAAALSARPLWASVPGNLAASAIHVAKLVSSGLPLPAGLAAIARGVKTAMFMHRLKLTAAGLVAAGLLTAGIGSLWATPEPTPPPAPAAPRVVKDAPTWTVKHTIKHTTGVTAVAFGADVIATGDADGNLTLWDAQTGKETKKLIDVSQPDAPMKARIDALAFTPDAKWLHIVNQNTTALHACSLDPNKFAFPGFGGEGMKMFGTSPDGELYFYARGTELTLTKNKLPENMVGGVIEGRYSHTKAVELACMSADNATIVTVTEDGVLRGWDAVSRKELWAVNTQKLVPAVLAISPDGKTLAVGGGFSLVKLFETATGNELAALEGHTKAVKAVAFSPDGKRLATAADDTTIRFWDAATHKPIATIAKAHDAGSGVDTIAFSPDGAMLVTGSADKTAKVWQFGK